MDQAYKIVASSQHGTVMSERISELERMPNTRLGATMTRKAVNGLIARRVAETLEARDAAENLEPLVEGGGEQEDENGDDYDGGNRGNGNGGNRNEGGNGNGNGEGNDNGNDNGNGNGNGGGNGFNFRVLCMLLERNDLTAYTRRFQELVLLCTRMVPDEEDKVERFIEGLPNNIQGNVIAATPTRL
ncbi:hypothetical protein Tco_1019976 [Tanacetum coccineum]|uniref:Reverse transcriptase domain-containing protein n=1 Tax=Tanacetum coccineum TaxID=301880 RepID=A0ABQ5FYR1_9ASTR